MIKAGSKVYCIDMTEAYSYLQYKKIYTVKEYLPLTNCLRLEENEWSWIADRFLEVLTEETCLPGTKVMCIDVPHPGSNLILGNEYTIQNKTPFTEYCFLEEKVANHAFVMNRFVLLKNKEKEKPKLELKLMPWYRIRNIETVSAGEKLVSALEKQFTTDLSFATLSNSLGTEIAFQSIERDSKKIGELTRDFNLFLDGFLAGTP